MAVHEYTHLMIHQSGMEIPPWLNEGLAELYSSLEPSGEKILVGQLIPARLHVLRSEPWIPLATLVAVDHSSPYYNEKSRAGMFYAESWALVHMLNLDPAYQPQLKTLVAALNQNDPPAAFAKAYGKPIDEVDAALRAYFSAPTVHAELFDVQLPKSVDAPEIQPPRRFPHASHWPNCWRTVAAGARRRVRPRSVGQGISGPMGSAGGPRTVCLAAAQVARRRATISPEPWNWDAGICASFLLYARVLGYNNQPKEEAAVLSKAATLFPESDEVKLELGATLVRNGNYDEAAAALLAIKKLGTAEQSYRLYYNLAYAQYRLGDAVHARENSDKARTYTKIPAAIADIDRLQRALDARQAARRVPLRPSMNPPGNRLVCGAARPPTSPPTRMKSQRFPNSRPLREPWRTWNAAPWPNCTCVSKVRSKSSPSPTPPKCQSMAPTARASNCNAARKSRRARCASSIKCPPQLPASPAWCAAWNSVDGNP